MSTIASVARPSSRWGASAATTRNRTLAFVALAGVLASGIVAYAAAVNPDASPAGAVGSLARALYVLTPVAVGIYAWRRHPEERLGQLLILFALVAAIWTLNGSSDPALFGVARLVGVVVAPLYGYLVLSFPEGRLHSHLERWAVGASAALIAACWVPLVFVTRQPVIATPLVRCAPDCPHNVFFAGTVPGLEQVLEFGVRFGYAVTLVGVVVLLLRRLRASTAPMRRMLAPVLLASITYAGALAFYLAVQPRAVTVGGWIVIAIVPIIPLALLVGLAREQVFVRSALARLVAELPDFKDTEQVRAAMAAAFKDESMEIFFWRAADGRYVDRHDMPVQLPQAGASTAVTKLEDNREPVAAVVHDAVLSEDSRFIRAIVTAAMMGVDNAHLEAELKVSRRRLVRAADTARERFERDLHDGAQQQLVAMRVRLQLAVEAIEAGSDDAAKIVERIGDDMDAALADLRGFAQGMYPQLLTSFGLEQALKAAARTMTLPTVVRSHQLGRYEPDVEAAVYFSCLEALQNASKHAGPDAVITTRLWCSRGTLHFEVTDTGIGFDQGATRNGSGLTNVRDRIGAVGGTTVISSSPGQGTSISGAIRIA